MDIYVCAYMYLYCIYKRYMYVNMYNKFIKVSMGIDAKCVHPCGVCQCVGFFSPMMFEGFFIFFFLCIGCDNVIEKY